MMSSLTRPGKVLGGSVDIYIYIYIYIYIRSHGQQLANELALASTEQKRKRESIVLMEYKTRSRRYVNIIARHYFEAVYAEKRASAPATTTSLRKSRRRWKIRGLLPNGEVAEMSNPRAAAQRKRRPKCQIRGLLRNGKAAKLRNPRAAAQRKGCRNVKSAGGCPTERRPKFQIRGLLPNG
jgi:hypothetical protein